ncbi:MAG: hypothetical protein KAG97_00200 [Victivallales bacterium]|nr:hypothetical protein [Victivallales bacterium]
MRYVDSVKINLKNGCGLVRKDLDSPELRSALETPETLLNSAEILKNSRTTKAGVAKLAPSSPFGAEEVFVKRFNAKGLWYSFRYLFRKPRPFRVWRAAFALDIAGIPTPKPIAALVFKDGVLPAAAYLVRESVGDVVPTLELFERIVNDDDARDEYVDAVCGLFAKTHDSGFFHGDAKCSNIYAVRNLENGALGCSLGLWDLLSCKIGDAPLREEPRRQEMTRVAESFAEIANRLGKAIAPSDSFELFWNNYNERTCHSKIRR